MAAAIPAAGQPSPPAAGGQKALIASRTSILLLTLFSLLLIAVRPAASDNNKPVELNPSVLLLGEFDWRPYKGYPDGSYGYTSRCTDMVKRAAAAAGGSRLNFIPTLYWADDNRDGYVDYFCIMDDNMQCRRMTWQDVHLFRWGLTLCFREAVHLNLGISIVPHLDDGGGSKAWRNGLVFNPLEQYGGLSYMDIMLHPIADALAAAMRPEPAGFRPATRVWFAMQGEMSATIMRYPLEYISAAQQLKQRIAQARPSAEELVAAHQQAGVTVWDEATGAQALLEPVNLRTAGRGALPESLVKMGVSFNFNKLEAANTGGASSWRVLAFGFGLGRGGGNTGGGINYDDVKSLFYNIDYIGISSYAALKPDFDKDELQNAAFQFFQEFLEEANMDVAALIKERGIELHYSEYGLGGGTSPHGNRRAWSAAEAAHTPFYGIFGPYKSSLDPWRNENVRGYLHSFYRRTLDWLAAGGGPTYPVQACFMWNLGSWDVLAVYKESSGPEGSYFDGHTAHMIKGHNEWAMSA